MTGPLKFVTHNKRITRIAREYGWLPGVRYTHLRDLPTDCRLGFLDIEWRNYDFGRHLAAVRATLPMLTVAKDVENRAELDFVIEQAHRLNEYAAAVIVVPKDPALAPDFERLIPSCFILGYSVPTRYGGTEIPPALFRRSVHLLGGRPDVQRRLADDMDVISLDCNRFSLDAAYGDYFDGTTFRPHPIGGYERCLRASLENMNTLWQSYRREPGGKAVDGVSGGTV